MLFKENLEETVSMYDSFWNHERRERPLLSMVSCRENYTFPKPTDDPRKQWFDLDDRIEFFKARCRGLNFHAEAMPFLLNNFGPGVLANYMGSQFAFDSTTFWFDVDPLIKDYENRPRLEVREDSELLKSSVEFRRKLVENGIYQGVTDLGGSLDIMASLRGTEQMLMDLVMNPDEVQSCLEEIDACWVNFFKYFSDLDAGVQDYHSAWMELYCRDTWYPLQQDVSVNISPQMFDEFCLPSLCRQASCMKYPVYHLDGPGQIKHLDSILAIDSLHTVEVTALPKAVGGLDVTNKMWWPVYEKIQKSGKGLIIVMSDQDDLKELIQNLDHTSLYISTVIEEKNFEDVIAFSKQWNK